MIEFRRDFMSNLPESRRTQLVAEGGLVVLGITIPAFPHFIPFVSDNLTPEFNHGSLILGAALVGFGLASEGLHQAVERLPRLYRRVQTSRRR